MSKNDKDTKFDALANLMPKFDILLSFHKLLGSSMRIAKEISDADELSSAPVAFLSASQVMIDKDKKDVAKALYSAGCAISDVDFKKLVSLLDDVSKITSKLDVIGTNLSNELKVSSQYSYTDTILLDWVKEAWEMNMEGSLPANMSVELFNIDANGNGFIVASAKVGDKTAKFKVIIMNHEPLSLNEMKKGVVTAELDYDTDDEDDADDTDDEYDADETDDSDDEKKESDDDKEDMKSEWCYCPNCGGDLH